MIYFKIDGAVMRNLQTIEKRLYLYLKPTVHNQIHVQLYDILDIFDPIFYFLSS